MEFILFDTALGRMGLEAEDCAITRVYLPNEPVPCADTHETPLLADGKQQLLEYLEGLRNRFTLPLSPRGTAFRRQVWDALLDIPYGTTITYGQLACAIGKQKATRAVGQANHHNPIPILIPCHRVVGAQGALTGYGGGLDLKKALLRLEANASGPQ